MTLTRDHHTIDSNQVLDYDTKVVMTEINNTVTYVGESLTHGASTADPVWRIYRTYTITGGLTRKEYAVSTRLYDQVWDNRASYFTNAIPPFSNLFSTSLDGVNDYMTIFSPTSLATLMGDRYTVSLWLKFNSVPTAGGVFNLAGTVFPQAAKMKIELVTGGKINLTVRDDANHNLLISGVTVLSTNTWYHVVAVRDSGFLALYINGVGDSTAFSSVIGTISPTIGYIGSINGSGNFIPGKMDEISIWDSALSPSQVTTLYNSGTPTDLDTAIPSKTPITWWRMGDGDTFPVVKDLKNSYDLTCTNMTVSNFNNDVP